MSKQSNQRYRKEMGLNHKERAKNSNNNQTSNNAGTTFKDMPSREGYGDGSPYGTPPESGQ